VNDQIYSAAEYRNVIIAYKNGFAGAVGDLAKSWTTWRMCGWPAGW